MIRHVVMWKFLPMAEGRTRLENMEKVREELYSLLPIIPEIKRMEIGFDITHSDASADLMLLTEFESVEALRVYAEHPEHLKVAAYVRKVTQSRIAHDSEIEI